MMEPVTMRPAGLTFSEKILGAKADAPVRAGQIVEVTPDIALSCDDTAAIIESFRNLGTPRILDPDMHVIVLDHCAPASSEACAAQHRTIRAFVEAQGIENFFDIDAGICHQVLPEQGFALPGRLIVGSDPHTTTCGALGAFAAAIGRAEMAVIMATGKIWLRVPETMRIEVQGRFPAGVAPKDLILRIIGDVGTESGRFRAMEFRGPAITGMAVSGRLTLCNMAAEMGVKNAYVEPDSGTLAYLNGRARGNFDLVASDPDASFREVRSYDVSQLDPQVGCPREAGTVVSVSQVAGQPVQQILVGGCANGRLDDLQQAAAVLKNHRVASGTRLLILPASREVLQAALADGTLAALLEAGAVVLNPNCGPCLGSHEGALAPGECTLTTGNRNIKGRPDGRNAAVYLASPWTCAASAITGRITDVREVAVGRQLLPAGLATE